MLDSFVDDLIAKAQATPYFHLDGYMNRWWVNPPKPNQICSRIHQILRSDNERHMHDHPWDYTTIILRGRYIEHSLKYGVTECPAGTVLHRLATDYHKLVLPDGPVWTLFISGEYKQRWGFFTERGKIPWRIYLGATAEALYDSNNPFDRKRA